MNVLPVLVQMQKNIYRAQGHEPTHLFLGEMQWQELRTLTECTPRLYMGLHVVLTDQDNLVCVTGHVMREHHINIS